MICRPDGTWVAPARTWQSIGEGARSTGGSPAGASDRSPGLARFAPTPGRVLRKGQPCKGCANPRTRGSAYTAQPRAVIRNPFGVLDFVYRHPRVAGLVPGTEQVPSGRKIRIGRSSSRKNSWISWRLCLDLPSPAGLARAPHGKRRGAGGRYSLGFCRWWPVLA